MSISYSFSSTTFNQFKVTFVTITLCHLFLAFIFSGCEYYDRITLSVHIHKPKCTKVINNRWWLRVHGGGRQQQSEICVYYMYMICILYNYVHSLGTLWTVIFLNIFLRLQWIVTIIPILLKKLQLCRKSCFIIIHQNKLTESWSNACCQGPLWLYFTIL